MPSCSSLSSCTKPSASLAASAYIAVLLHHDAKQASLGGTALLLHQYRVQTCEDSKPGYPYWVLLECTQLPTKPGNLLHASKKAQGHSGLIKKRSPCRSSHSKPADIASCDHHDAQHIHFPAILPFTPKPQCFLPLVIKVTQMYTASKTIKH